MELQLTMQGVSCVFEEQQSGQNIVPGDPVYLVQFEPVALKKDDLDQLLKRSKNHELTAVLR